MTKKDYKNLIILEVLAIAIMLFLTHGKYVFGSQTDWAQQHYFFADSFRKLFYHTGNFFPSFLFNVGNGQNIYYFSYYGLYNPIFLCSFFLPFVSLGTFIQQAMLVLITLTTLFYYKWLRRRFTSEVSFLCSVIFLCAAPFIYHGARHIMFISYMPFILLGLYGVDMYFDKKNKTAKLMLILSVLGIILCNYFFSIVSIFVLVLYGVFVYIEKNKFNIKDFLISGGKFLMPLCLGALLSAFYVFPTLYTILHGRVKTNVHFSLASVLLPNLDLNHILYSTYNLGLTLLFVLALVSTFFSKKKSLKILGICMSVIFLFPVFIYALNGFMYIEYKVLIPFLPLAVLIIAYYIQNILNKDIDKKPFAITLILVIISSLIHFRENIWIDFIVTLVMMLLLMDKKKLGILLSTICFVVGIVVVDSKSNFVTKEEYNNTHDKTVEKQIKKVLKEEKSLYRFNYLDEDLTHIQDIKNMDYYNSSVYSSLSNTENRDSFINVFNNERPHRNSMILNESSNVLYNMYMGNKYVYQKNGVKMYGYEKVGKNLYKNENVFPIGYSTYKVMSLKNFKKLKYPYNVEALLNYTIVDDDRIVSEASTNIETYSYDIDALIKNNKYITKEKDKYVINNTTGKDLHIKINRNKELKNKILLIDFDMEYNESCSVGDQYITVLGQKNLYTCKEWKYNNKNSNFNYVLSLDKIEDDEIVVSNGKHIIKNIQLYLMDYSNIETLSKDLTPFVFDKKKTKGDVIEGDIQVNDYGYLVFSIPYDTGYKFTVDGKNLDYEKVNNNYIGMKIKPGTHHVKIVYTAPFSKAGRVVSLLAIIFIAIYLNKKHVYKARDFINKMELELFTW